MDDAQAVAAVLVAPQLERFRELCEVAGPIEPRFDGFTKHVLLTDDRAFVFPRNHTVVDQIERECAAHGTIDHPTVPSLLRGEDPAISPYPFFALTRITGESCDRLEQSQAPAVAEQLGAALAASNQGGLKPVMAKSRDTWDRVREFALGLPAAEEDHPWGESVVKVRTKPGAPPWRRGGVGVYGPMFLWLGRRDADTHQVAVKLTTSYDEARAVASAAPTSTSGLGQWGWLTVPLAGADLALVCDWVDESYRNVAPRRLVTELDQRAR